MNYQKLIMLLVDHDNSKTAMECRKYANTTIFSFGKTISKEILRNITLNVTNLTSAVEAVMKYYE